MSTTCVFFICPVCFRVCEDREDCHDHRMIVCDVDELKDVRRKPLIDASGRLRSHAPRWFLEAVGWIPGR